jgi:hypothetical protein
MAVTCAHCGGGISMKMSKVALAVGGSVAMIPLAAAFGLKAGLIALGVAAWQGNKNALQLLRLKQQLMLASEKAGSFFYCSKCGKDASVSEVFSQL